MHFVLNKIFFKSNLVNLIVFYHMALLVLYNSEDNFNCVALTFIFNVVIVEKVSEWDSIHVDFLIINISNFVGAFTSSGSFIY